MQEFSFVLLVLFGLYLVYEVWGWYAGNRAQLTPGQFRRRLAGGLLLEIALLLWVLADPLLHGRRPAEKLLYLLFAMLLPVVAMILAIREATFVARQYSRWRSDLSRKMSRSDLPPDPPRE